MTSHTLSTALQCLVKVVYWSYTELCRPVSACCISVLSSMVMSKNTTTTTGYFLFVLGVSLDYRSENVQRNQMFKATRTVRSNHRLYFFIFDF